MWLWAGRVAQECRQDEIKSVILKNKTNLHGCKGERVKKVKVKVKQSRYRPAVAQRVPGS